MEALEDKPTDLIILNQVSAVEIFTGGKLDHILEAIKTEVDAFVPITDTKKERDEIASFAYKIRQGKVTLDNLGKELVAKDKERIKKIDGERKRLRDELDVQALKAREALDIWEEEQRVAAEEIENAIDGIRSCKLSPETQSSEQMKVVMESLASVVIDKTFGEREPDVRNLRDGMLEQMEKTIEAKVKYEAEQIELDLLRKEKAERDAKEAEEARIAKEKETRERIEREAKEKAEREAAEEKKRIEKEALDAKAAEAKAKQDVIDEKLRAEAAAIQAEEDKKVAIEQAKKDERERIELKEKARKEAEERIKGKEKERQKELALDKAHIKKINNEAADVLELHLEENPFLHGKDIVKLIALKKIPHVTINY